MLKSFFKKVFSSSPEESSETDRMQENQADEAAIDVQDSAHRETEESEGNQSYQTFYLNKEALEENSFDEIDSIIAALYQKGEQTGEIGRLRFHLDDRMPIIDPVMANRLSQFLSQMELEVADLTFFIDKQDQETMEIYRSYVFPQNAAKVNHFLQERCLMMYETSLGLGLNYQDEIVSFFQALDMAMGPNFFEEFDRWREEVLKQHAQEQSGDEGGIEPKNVNPEWVMLKISREEVENENIQQIDQYLKKALQSPQGAKEYRGTLLFSFYGFGKNEDLFKLMNRKDVNDWASLLVENHPYIFYFLNDVEYPMTAFLTSLVVTTEIENQSVYYNEEELAAFRTYIGESLGKLADWLGEEKELVIQAFERHFQDSP